MLLLFKFKKDYYGGLAVVATSINGNVTGHTSATGKTNTVPIAIDIAPFAILHDLSPRGQ
jgi:hypothetical protein